MKLLFIRHAESTGNQERRMQGNGEFSLSGAGEDQAKRLGNRLRRENWLPTRVYSSPLKRARMTAEIVMDQVFGDRPEENSPSNNAPSNADLAQEIRFNDDLREYQNGIFQGLTWQEAQAQHSELCDQLEASVDWLPVPGAETLVEGRQRAERFIETVLSECGNQDRVWVVAHSWILQHLISSMMGCDRSWRMSVYNTAIFEFWLDRDRWFKVLEGDVADCSGEGDGEDFKREQMVQNRFNTSLWQIRRFNDTAHLVDLLS
ncbi:MAG: histidine phosphatase family protein [Cyanobacteria bacterium P01_D01_bin.73]